MEPLAATVTVFAPVVSLPLASVSTLLTVQLALMVTPLALLIARFAMLFVNSGPDVWAALPWYSSVAARPYVGTTLAVAVPCLDNFPLTVTPVVVLAPDPARVRFWYVPALTVWATPA